MKKKSYSFQKNISKTIRDNHLLKNGDKVVVAVSGGSDSIALLHVLTTFHIKINLMAVYVNHCLRPDETGQEITNIQKLCSTLKIRFITKTVDVEQLRISKKMSTEEAARFLRYQALDEVKKQYNFNKIAVGHNADDQVEEFFIRLFRGSGTTGLSGMQLQQGDIIRPLLFESKTAIEQYLIEENIPWSIDSSNLTRDFLRNRIRLDLLPEIEANYNPGIRHTVLNSMNILETEDNYLTSTCEQSYNQCTKEIPDNSQNRHSISISLDIEIFLTNHLAIRRRILEKICWKMLSRPSFVIVGDLDHLAQTGENGKELHLKGGLRVTKTENNMQFSCPPLQENKRGRAKLPEPYKLTINTPGTYRLPEGTHTVTLTEHLKNTCPVRDNNELHVDMDSLDFPLILRGMHPGERFTPYNGIGSKKISRYFNDQKLDKSKRSSWPVLFADYSVIAVIGLTIDHQFRVKKTTKRILKIAFKDTSAANIED